MYRLAPALVLFLVGCASREESLDTCGFLAKSSGLNVSAARIARSEQARWMDELGLSTKQYHRIHWYQNNEDIRLVCLYTSRCKAEVRTFRQTGTGWQQFEPPDAGLLCVTGA
jgi:hypothetical protein